ncbi:hypothetical protein [Manganibacter manganicus]|uniref:Uncharacterized protein n=1 Tax=Manganibacter manganicus TaxID=1873176 RepID=A0A1V8RJZ1_9HYPH|nr:hypothetical protein [Pseudaminobacter manganicus]OQM73436.1 hypothetical protein BFN67_09105 [Pseudaminobacter manganicus]
MADRSFFGTIGRNSRTRAIILPVTGTAFQPEAVSSLVSGKPFRIARGTTKISLANILYNMKCLIYLDRIAAT